MDIRFFFFFFEISETCGGENAKWEKFEEQYLLQAPASMRRHRDKKRERREKQRGG